MLLRELSIEILKWLRPEMWEYYSEDLREEYIKELIDKLTLILEHQIRQAYKVYGNVE